MDRLLQTDHALDRLVRLMRDNTVGILSFNHKGKWHVCKVQIKAIDHMCIRLGIRQQQGHPVELAAGQPVGISFKYGFLKVVFHSQVIDLRWCPDGQAVLVDRPAQVDCVDRRGYFRVPVPRSLRVNVVMWHRSGKAWDSPSDYRYIQGILVDISAGGAQVAIPNEYAAEGLIKGQYIGLRFTPLPYQTPITFVAQVRTVLPTADGTARCIGLQAVGLEASKEGRQVLARLLEIVEQYKKLN